MATSRTGTSKWKRVRAQLIRERAHVCHWCAKILDAKATRGAFNAIEIDHLVPVSLAPELAEDMGNLTLACFPCNRSKGKQEQPKTKLGAKACAFHDPPTSTCPHSRAW